MGLTLEEIAENHKLGHDNPDLRIPLLAELDTDGKIRLDRTSIRRDETGVTFNLLIEDGFDYNAYMDELKRKG